MKPPHLGLLTRLAAILLLAGVVVAAERGLPKNPLIKEPNTSTHTEDQAISIYLKQNRDSLVRVTGQPHYLQDHSATYCVPPSHVPHEPHVEFWIQVFINPEAAAIIRSGKGVYPEGTIILKQKAKDRRARQTVFYTGMRKREKDYNSAYGDWEFFTLDQTGTKVTARGRIDSCMDCHANWKETDFVSRKYLRPPPAAPVTR